MEDGKIAGNSGLQQAALNNSWQSYPEMP